MAGHKDHSGTPLWKKLGIAEGTRVHVSSAPDGFETHLTAVAPLPRDVTFLGRPGADLDVVVLFVTRRADLLRRFPRAVRSLRTTGRLWVAWPKKPVSVDPELDFTTVQRIGLDAGLVDNKSASVIDVFQGLQFVVPVRDRR